MPLAVRSSVRRRRKNPDEKLPERPGESSDQVMAPTRMKLRVRRRENATEGATGGDGQQQDEEAERSRGSNRRKNNNMSAAAATSTSSPPSSSAASAPARVVMAAEETSPDSKCPICLDRFNNLAYLDRCLHRFCFPCIQEWSHNKAECPLCKQPFASILHSVRAEDDFKEYTLRPAPANSSIAATAAMVAAMASAARSDHQMRLMLRRHRAEEGGETTTRRRRREREGANRRARVWQWYLDSPPLALPPLPHPSSVAAEDSEEGEELADQRRGRGDLLERGVIFEGLTGLGGSVAPLAPTDRASRRLMTRLAARQRLQREGGTVRRLRERETVAFRRALYRCGVRVRSVAGDGSQGQQQRDITAESFRRNPVHLNRLRPWLRRELTVLYGAHGSLVDIVQRIIMARLARHGLEDTPTIEEELRPFLLARTDHFLHELVSFARSPLSLENYDLQAVYEPPDAALEVDGTSSSSDSSSVIAISEGEEEEGGRMEEIPLRREGGAHDDVIQTGSCLSLSVWDDETPGPSYSTAEPSCSLSSLSFSPAPQGAANEEGGGKREEEEEVEECLIVGYKKPIAERTPELVQLSSDTEEEAEEKKEEKKEEKTAEKIPVLPSLPPPISFSPTIPPSTSGTCREEGAPERDNEAGRCRSWSGSSGRSRSSVCMLSPETPRERDRRRERERKRTGSEKKRRRKRSRRVNERKSGTLYNPNRSIYPAIMRPCIHASSPLHSSADSASPLPPSPPESTVSYHCSQASPLTSSISSPCSSSLSSSPLFSSPQLSSQTPPTPSISPSYHSNSHHREKPGGKRKYKSRHLDSNDKDPTWRPSSSQGGRRRERREKERRQRGREGGRRRERPSRGDSSSSRRRREERSPSVEIIYEGTINPSAALPPARRRHRKRHSRAQLSSSPVIITLDSDSSHDNLDINNHSSSSSPLSSQQTVDFCDLPPLPLMPSAGMGGALNAEIGELPADILDQGSDGSETEPAGPAAGTIAVVNSDNSDGEVDVENVEESGSMTRSAEERGPKRGREEIMETTRETGTVKDGVSAATGPNQGARTQREDVPLDSRLLATILDDLKGISAPTFESSTSLDLGRTHSWDLPNKEDQLAEKRQPSFSEEKLSKDIRDQNHSSSSSSLPLLEQHKEARVQESRDVPPLLKKASPIQTHNRNTPPPLKHKDAGSPHLLPIPSADLQTSAELPGNNQVIPPISTLKRHFNSTMKGLQHMASTSNSSTTDFNSTAPSEVGELVHSKRNKLNVDSPSGSQIKAHLSPHADFNSFFPSNSREVPVGQTAPFSDFHSLPPIDFQSKASRSKEKPAHTNSTSRGCQVAPVILRPSSRDLGEGTLAGGDVFSGAKCNETSRPGFVSATDSRTQNPAAPVDSCSQEFPTSREILISKTGATGACSFGDDLEVQMGSVSSSYKRTSQINLHCTTPDKHTNEIFSPLVDKCLNHTPFTSTNFQMQHRKQVTLSKPVTDSHSDPHHSDLKAVNHVDQTSNTQFCTQSWSEQNTTIDSQPKPRPTIASHPQPSTPIYSHPTPRPTIDSHPQSQQSTDSHPEPLTPINSHPKPRPTIGSNPPSWSAIDSHHESQPIIDSHSKTPLSNFQNSTDNHISLQSVENFHNSHSSIDSRSNSESPVDEHSSSSFWKTHARLK